MVYLIFEVEMRIEDDIPVYKFDINDEEVHDRDVEYVVGMTKAIEIEE